MSNHIAAKPGDIAPTILLPGDPLRAKWIAENFFDDVVQYNTVRNMFGFTGTYKGHRVSAQGTGMGQPSMSIYAHELFEDYGVQTAIRVGTCGGLAPTKLRDVVIAVAASTDSHINRRQHGGIDVAPFADFGLLAAAVEAAKASPVNSHVGGIITLDLFYDNTDVMDQCEKLGILAVEMETSALYTLAMQYRRRALTIATVSDLIRTHELTPVEEREQGFRNMVEIALKAAFA